MPFVRNKLRPCLVGGTPRSYDLFLLSASGQIANEVAAWVEQGVIKQAVIDMKYPMEQLVEVSGLQGERSAWVNELTSF